MNVPVIGPAGYRGAYSHISSPEIALNYKECLLLNPDRSDGRELIV